MLKRDRRTSRTILTSEGLQTYNRYRVYAVNTDEYPQSVETCSKEYGQTSFYPLDEYLGIDNLPFKFTADMALVISETGATTPSYQEAAKQLKKKLNIDISDNMVREIVDYIGEIVLEEERRLVAERIKGYDPKKLRLSKRGRRPKNGYVLYFEADGAMFNTRKEKGTTGSDQDASTWKENKLGLVFSSEDLTEEPEKETDGRTIYRIGRREYISTTEGIDEFRERALYLLLKNGLEDASDLVVLSDGAPWIRKIRERFFPNATQILDLFHLKENAMHFAQFLFHNDSSKYYPWWVSVCKQLEDGEWRKVLAISELAEYKLNKSTPAGVVNLYHYIWNNRDIIDYPTYRAKGYFVGSGAIESGNKTVLQERLKLAGMKWYLSTAESLLALRSKLKSDLWEIEVVPLVRVRYNKWHLQQDNVRAKQRDSHRKNRKSV